ncbi:uncharacterized protein K452DRAFT_225673 [Aplosporella prunicola CBS 121167]|uniref:Fork-head domain-containing protein n=1 Tax=Aplosporella prunicola CBS 121167 TaxID=1176127 RepID=A0A6A6BJM7_9PEZI|nr:uncharacterized protein K452DRAFT_225673 [Aplosporella prunicola CBS 121167]KAF2143017.1 hypothetical protein K452DRAFT_225673 [Aplosporella prunicola CBS 121167]
MAATRRQQQPLQIFQDPVTSFDHHDVAGAEAAFLSAFGPVTDVSSDHHTLLNPSSPETSAQSPVKHHAHSSSPAPHALAESNINSIHFSPPRQTHFTTDSPLKKPSLPSKANGAAPKSQNALFTTFPTVGAMDKENDYAAMFASHPSQYSDHALSHTKNVPRRQIGDTAPLRDRHSKKGKAPEEDQKPVPAPSEMPPVEDDGSKPAYSYATLIGMAILRAPQRRLTLAQIYKWISDTFSYYRTSETGWQNSIRHNLSLNKAFIKQERPKDDPGKGNYWAIEPGFERQFLKDKPRRLTNQDGPGFLQSIHSDILRPPTAPTRAAAMGSFHLQSTPKGNSIDSSKFPEEPELSSDATIPASDPAIHDGQDAGNENDMPPASHAMRSSPPPAEIHSSPPAAMARHAHHDQDGTPPRAPRFLPSSGGGRKRKFSALGDSGYYSSIESSAVKGNPLGTIPTSEADLDRPAIKRGRAEEEIARMRGSSYDSPTKGRPLFKQPTSFPSSSPFPLFEKNASELQAPLTPAVIFKKPAKPPASISPNTNLRNHRNRIRELIGSPDKTLGVLSETNPWSPAFHLPDEEHFNLLEDGFNTHFDVFNDSPVRQTLSARGSPEKRTTKRPTSSRAISSSNILADITGTRVNSVATPEASKQWLKPPASSRNLRDFFANPSVPSPMKTPTAERTGDDFFGVEMQSDDEEEGGLEIDILQGFQKIGTTRQQPQESPSKRGSTSGRPYLGRAASTMF